MRSQAFAAVMGVVCGILVLVCLWLGVRFWKVYRLRRAFPTAVQLYNEGKLEEALPHLDKAIAHAPASVEPYRLAAKICSRLDRPDRVAHYYTQMLKHAKGAHLAEAHLHLGALALEGGGNAQKVDLEGAIAHLAAALEAYEEAKDPSKAATASLLLAVAHVRQGDRARAKPHFRRAAQSPRLAGGAPVLAAASLWQIAELYRSGKLADLIEAWNTYLRLVREQVLTHRSDLQAAIGLALASHAADPSLSTSERQLCVEVMERVPTTVRDRHALRLHLLAAAAWERLGEMARARDAYREAYKAAPTNTTAQRGLARALFAVAGRATDAKKRQQLLDEGVELYRKLLVSGKLPDADKEALALALATLAWSKGQREEAKRLLATVGAVQSPLVERMKATVACEKADYPALLTHLRRAQELDKSQTDVAALLKRLSTPPEIHHCRVNRLGPYDPQPIVAASFAPRAVPVPIPADQVAMSLDGKSVKPIVTAGDCFFRPADKLPLGDHKVGVSVTDSLGLKATESFSFRIETDKEPPAIVGISPAPDSDSGTRSPVVTFRCSDPSGIDARSLTVTFSAPGRREVTLVRHGVYQMTMDTRKVKIAKGARVPHGLVRFQSSKPFGLGECRVSVTVADVHGNRTSKQWKFQCTE